MGFDLALALLDPLYEAATQPEKWQVFLRAASEILHADHAGFILHDPENEQTGVKADLGYTDQMRHDVEEMTYLNPWIAEVQKHQSTGWFSGGVEDVMSMETYRSTAFYNEFYRKNGIEWAAAVVIFGPRGSMQSIVFSRSDGGSPFSPEEKQLLRELVPHLTRVFDARRVVAALRAGCGAGQHALDLMGAACITLDGAGRLLFMNRRAEALLAEGGAITTRDRRLIAAQSGEQKALDACIDQACAYGMRKSLDPGTGALVLHSRQESPFYVSVLPYRSSWDLLEDLPSALVFIATPEERGSGEHRLWRAMFDLSPAECRVAEMMKQGMEVAEISATINIKVDTVRYYQKSIYRKTSVRGQGPLMRLLTRLPSDGA
jgi:DNA-binding CsgD family transcriptional regulator